MIVIGWVLSGLVYLIISNIVLRLFLDLFIVEFTEIENDEFLMFIIALFLPIVLLGIAINEVSKFLYNVFKNN